jgi:hypothetical protein
MGITVSFWLNEVSIDIQNEKNRIKVLNSLQTEIHEISEYCKEREATWLKDINLLDLFLYPQNGLLDIDSISKLTTSKSRIETFFIIYRVFDPPMNRYHSIINSGDLKYVDSEKIKEILSRLHNTSFSYVETTVEYEKQLKQSFLPFLATNHSQFLLATDDKQIDINRYSEILFEAIQKNKKLKAKLVLIKRYLGFKLNFLELYNKSLKELENEIYAVLNEV